MAWIELQSGDDLRYFESDGEIDLEKIFNKSVQCIDRSLGKPVALLADDGLVVRYFVVSLDTISEFGKGKEVIVPIDAIRGIDAENIYIEAVSDELEEIPSYRIDRPITIDMERAAYRVFGIPAYWEGEAGFEESENYFYRYLESHEVYPKEYPKRMPYSNSSGKVVHFPRKRRYQNR
ncbi:MAG: hypothetical protein QXT63_03930 [Thermoplasmata archaeon]